MVLAFRLLLLLDEIRPLCLEKGLFDVIDERLFRVFCFLGFRLHPIVILEFAISI